MLRDLIKPESGGRFNGGPHGPKAGLRNLALVRRVSPAKGAKSHAEGEMRFAQLGLKRPDPEPRRFAPPLLETMPFDGSPRIDLHREAANSSRVAVSSRLRGRVEPDKFGVAARGRSSRNEEQNPEAVAHEATIHKPA